MQRGRAVQAAGKAGSAANHGAANHGAANHGAANHGAANHGAANHGAASHGAANHGAANHGAASHGAANDGAANGGAANDGAADHGAGPPDRVVTIPNGISVARLAGVPVFLWLVLGLRSQTGDWWAVGLLVAAGASDWLDGKIARALNQQSRLGQMLDPAADRLYIAATLIALAIRGIIPWWLFGLLAARELALAVVLAVLRRHNFGPLQVSFVGKTATLCLLYAFPLLFLGSHAASYAQIARVAGWAFAVWGSALYWCAALLYAAQARRLILQDRAQGRTGQL